MAVDFYDVKTREKVSIDDTNVMKTTFTTKNGQTRYGVRGKTQDGRMLTKFVSKADWDNMKYKEEVREAKPADTKASDSKSADTKATTKKSTSKKK